MNKKMIGFVALAIFIIGGGVILLKSDPVSKNGNLNNQYNNVDVVNSNITPASNVPAVNNVPASNTPVTNVPKTTTTNPKPTTTPVVKSGYTLADVAKHSSASSCWTAVYGNVYDVTSWIDQHPGGSRAILSMCGKDGTNSFDNQHGGQRRANAELASFKIGALSN